MKLYRVQLELSSPLVTPLKGDTIWGHFAWGIANHEGEESVQKFIEENKSALPSLITSSAFPHGYICKKMYEIEKRKENLSKEDYTKIKQEKKIKYQRAADFISVGEINVSSHQSIKFTEEIHAHNSILRTSGSVLDGSLYSINELWSEEQLFDLYILSSYEKERLFQFSEWAFENGFGADSSTGKGCIKVLKNIEEVKTKLSGNKYMALSPFVVPDMNEISDLKADIFVRSGRIGGAFVSEMSPFKKTVVLYDEGATFISEKPIQFIGEIISNVHSDSRIVQSAFAPVVPVD